MKFLKVLLPLVTIALTAPLAHAQCSLGNAAGTYGFTQTGTVPFAPEFPFGINSVGKLTLSPAGTLCGKEFRQSGSGVENLALTGTWTVDSGCTGTMTITLLGGGQAILRDTFDIVFDALNTELRGVQDAVTLIPTSQTEFVAGTLEGRIVGFPVAFACGV